MSHTTTDQLITEILNEGLAIRLNQLEQLEHLDRDEVLALGYAVCRAASRDAFNPLMRRVQLINRRFRLQHQRATLAGSIN
jgi:hypothetical protein